jgi:hypothetical protein
MDDERATLRIPEYMSERTLAEERRLLECLRAFSVEASSRARANSSAAPEFASGAWWEDLELKV